MAEGKKKKALQQLEASIKNALNGFATGIESKKLEKKIGKYSSDLAELILKQKDGSKKTKAAKAKKVPVKKVKSVIPIKKKQAFLLEWKIIAGG